MGVTVIVAQAHNWVEHPDCGLTQDAAFDEQVHPSGQDRLNLKN